MVIILASRPSCLGFDSQHSQKFSEENTMSMLLRLINDAAQRKVDSGLKLLIEHIKWQARTPKSKII